MGEGAIVPRPPPPGYATGYTQQIVELFPQENSASSCINLSSSSLCNFHMGFYPKILSPQNISSPKQSSYNHYPDKMKFHGKPFIYQPKGLKTEQTLPIWSR